MRSSRTPGRTGSHSTGTRVAQAAGLGLALLGVAFARQPKSLAAHAADPTYAEDVAPILYKNCAGCHRPGGLGPFSVLQYDSTVSHLDEMRPAVAQGQMPPWHAEGPHGVFRNDRRLSDSDRNTILRWIDAGAKPGDLAKLPPKPDFPTSWAMGTPDLVVSMPEDFDVPAEGKVEYMYFQVPTGLTEDKWIQAIEFMPGAREVVHHILVYAYVPPAAAPTPAPAPMTPPAGAQQQATPAPRPMPVLVRNSAAETSPRETRLDTLHGPPRNIGALIGGTAPGTNVMEFAPGTALRLRAGTILTFQMHYTAHGHEMKDRSKVGFRFAKEMPNEEIFASQFTNRQFTIPAGAKDVAIPAELGAGQPIRIWGLMPHTHLRGTRWQYKLVMPDSSSSVILDVPHYDFNWQTYYFFTKPLDIPAGAKIVSTAWYDNSPTNKSNPDAGKDVHWGDQTWEEMQYTGFLYSIPSRRLKPAGHN